MIKCIAVYNKLMVLIPYFSIRDTPKALLIFFFEESRGKRIPHLNILHWSGKYITAQIGYIRAHTLTTRHHHQHTRLSGGQPQNIENE